MKYQIRKGVFETNSSSTHAICISKNHTYDELRLPEQIEFHTDYFGWEFGTHTSPEDKASYLYSAIVNMNDDEYEKEAIEYIKKVLNKKGVSAKFAKDNGEYHCCIDHFGSDDMHDWLRLMLTDDSALMTYLFGDSFVITGNDNSDEFDEEMYPVIGKDKNGWAERDYTHYRRKYDGYDVFYKGN